MIKISFDVFFFQVIEAIRVQRRIIYSCVEINYYKLQLPRIWLFTLDQCSIIDDILCVTSKLWNNKWYLFVAITTHSIRFSIQWWINIGDIKIRRKKMKLQLNVDPLNIQSFARIGSSNGHWRCLAHCMSCYFQCSRLKNNIKAAKENERTNTTLWNEQWTKCLVHSFPLLW